MLLNFRKKIVVTQGPALVCTVVDGGALAGCQPLLNERLIPRLARKGGIAQCPVASMWRKNGVVPDAQIMLRTRPGIRLCWGGEARMLSRKVDISHAGQEVSLGLEDRRAVATFPQRAPPLVASVESRDVHAADTLHESGQRCLRAGRQEQLHLTGQQRVGVDGNLVLAGLLADDAEHVEIVCLLSESGLCCQRALHNKVRQTRDAQPGQAGHGRSVQAAQVEQTFMLVQRVAVRHTGNVVGNSPCAPCFAHALLHALRFLVKLRRHQLRIGEECFVEIAHHGSGLAHDPIDLVMHIHGLSQKTLELNVFLLHGIAVSDKRTRLRAHIVNAA